MGEQEHIDWRELKAAELQLKGNRLLQELDKLQKELGVMLKPVIVVSPDGSQASAQITIELIG